MNRAVEMICRWVEAVREMQQDALSEMQRLDAATAQHMQHGAMLGADPLTDSVLDQMAMACAQEGATPPSTHGTGLTLEQLDALAETQADDWWLDWIVPTVLTGVVVCYALHIVGWLR